MSLEEDVETYVRGALPIDNDAWFTRYVSKPRKIVHDAVWGTFVVEPHEVALLDTPLLQRLRFVRQTGAVYLTYPSAVHTRFEHSLGVLYNAGRIGGVFLDRAGDGRLDRKDVAILRLAALLHDTGHGPFSHTSEQFYSSFEEFTEYKAREPAEGDVSAGELLSSLMVRSGPFREFISCMNNHFKVDIDCDLIAQLITGTVRDDHMFLSEVVHGPFDADKLDYMHRDGMFSGLKMHVDLDRLFSSIDIVQAVDSITGRRMTRLAGSVSGVTPLTQIMFNKMILFTGMYHHHKVRAVDCMLWAMFEQAWLEKTVLGGRTLTSSVDFLRLTDDRVLIPELCNDETTRIWIDAIRNRDLWERALVISRRTVHEDLLVDGTFTEYVRLMGNAPAKIRARRALADEIWTAAGQPGHRLEVALDIPKLPGMDESKRMWITTGDGPPETLDKFLPISQWVELYGAHKWCSHVFCRREHKAIVAKAAEAVLQERLGLKLKPLARRFARTPE